jgi:hypothetical protein
MIDCAGATAGRFEWTTSARAEPEAVRDAAKLLSGGGAFPACALNAFLAAYRSDKSSPQVRWHGLVGAQSLLIAGGRSAAARSLLDSAVASGLQAANFLYAIDAAAGADMGSRPAETLGMLGTQYERLPPIALWLAGIWSAYQRDTATLSRVAHQLALHARSRQDSVNARALTARLVLLRGDTAGALGLLRALAPVAPRSELAFGLAEPLAGETMLLAEVLQARHQDAEAYRVASRLDHAQPALYLLYLPRSLALRIASARSAGRADEEARDRSRLARLRLSTTEARAP